MINTNTTCDSDFSWDAGSIFPSLESWTESCELLKSELESISNFKGSLGQSPEKLASYYELEDKLSCRLDKLYTWAHLCHDKNTLDSVFLALVRSSRELYSKLGALTAFAEPEILALSDEDLKSYLQSPALKNWHHRLQKLIRQKKHVLSEETEKTLAILSPALQASKDIFSAFNDSDLHFSSVKDENGKVHELTHGRYFSLLTQPDRVLRKNAFENYHQHFESWSNTLAASLGATVQKHVSLARVRGFDSALSAALSYEAIDKKVYTELIKTIRNKGLCLHHRYLNLRKRILKLDQLEYYDLYLPLVSQPQKCYTPQEAVDLVLESVKPLGKDYCDTLKQGLLGGWVDWFESEGKRSGAYSSGSYETKPYILMNFDGSLRDVFTLAHEAGHSMHSLYSRKNQTYANSHYPIFLAEVASTFNEQLLAQLLLQKEQDESAKMYLLNYQLEMIRTTFFRQSMFADFELSIHEKLESGVALSAPELKATYKEVLQAWFGKEVAPNEGVLAEWSRIPHFHYNFYVYQYATGIAASFALSKSVLLGLENGDTKALQNYLHFLQSGGSKDALPTLAQAGIDLSTPSATQVLLEQFEQLLQTFEFFVNGK